jgi:hypothetical protein
VGTIPMVTITSRSLASENARSAAATKPARSEM